MVVPGGGAAVVAVVEPEAEGGLVFDGSGLLGGGSHGGRQGIVCSCCEGESMSRVMVGFIPGCRGSA